MNDHQPVWMSRHGTRGEALVLDTESLLESLEGFRFSGSVISDEDEVSFSLAQFGVIGAGETFEDAVEDAAAILLDYAVDYLNRREFFRHTDRASHLPWVLRFLAAYMSESEADRSPAQLLYADMEAEAAEAASVDRRPAKAS